jgi:hypothetical protein
MDFQPPNESRDIPELIANRFRVEEVIGAGGTAVVYKVYDVSTDRQVALKQLSLKDLGDKGQRMVELFEREYYTLSHLSHPRVIAVYDYGVSETGPFYTMECLDGGDLQKLAPVRWNIACKLLLDICSALSLLHSRRMVHRDLSPRNIRCTSDGLAKLIDFGAMIPMGPCKQTVGTAPHVAPEVVNLQLLDGRADLYSFGTTLYFALTGRNAYPARSFDQLSELWRTKPTEPSECVKDIPKALDNLVMSLMQTDPKLRPANAAEVMERLSAIADLKIDEQLIVSQAYLTTPTLIGREKHLIRIRKRIIQAQAGHGSAFMVRGVAGVGRSRFIDACVLEGKLMGAIVVRADASDAQTGEYGVVRVLTKQLLNALPEEERADAEQRVEVIKYVLPELFGKGEETNPQSGRYPIQIRTRIQQELRQLFYDVSRRRPVLVTVDDIHRVDEPSSAFLAFLSYQISDYPIVEVVSAETNAQSTSKNAFNLLSEVALSIHLENLSGWETQKLLHSVFGEVPHVQLLADRLYRISEGNPRDVMQLTQHLVDKAIVRYQAGAWLLPDKIESGDLPRNMTQALSARIERLGAGARQIAETMALEPEQSFTFEECQLMADENSASRVVNSLDELVMADILRIDHERYTYRQTLWASALKCSGDIEREKRFHLKLSDIFERRGQEKLRVARHLLDAGEIERGLDLLVDFADQSKDLTNRDQEAYVHLLQTLPSDFFETFFRALDFCKKLHRPRRHVYRLQRRLAGISALLNHGETSYIGELLQQLYHDSGLAFYYELDKSMDSSERLGRALEFAQKKYESSSDEERALDPASAIRELAILLLETSAMLVSSCDYTFLEKFPSLEPLTPLSPAVGIVEKTVRSLGHRLAGRSELAIQGYQELLERTAQPDRGGLEDSHHKNSRFSEMRGIGMLQAVMGVDSALKWASEIETEPLYEISALHVRSLYYLWQGDIERAELYNKRTELLRIQMNPVEVFRNSYLSFELAAHAMSDDLTRVKHLAAPIRKLADSFPPWVPIRHYAQGEYHRIRGDYPSALSEIDQALKLTAPGRHQNWAHIMEAYLRTLLELERYTEVEKLGYEALYAAESQQLGFLCNYIRMPLAIAEARLGKRDSAVANSQTAISHFETMGSTGISLGLAYETRALVGLYSQDEKGYRTHLDLCGGQFQTKKNPALIAKFEKLVQEPRRMVLKIPKDVDRRICDAGRTQRFYRKLVYDKMVSHFGFKECTQCVLEMLNEHSGTAGGFLYIMQQHGLELCAHRGNHQPPKEMDTKVDAYFSNAMETLNSTAYHSGTIDSLIGFSSDWVGHDGDVYRPLLLGHQTEQGYAITGFAVLLVDPTKRFVYPTEVVSALSEYLLESGDVSTCVAA